MQGRVFQPLRPFLSTDQNNRDHRKIIVIDGKVAFTGGFNLADEYANRITLYGHWKDTAVALRGPAIQTFTALFLQMWNSEVAGEMQEDFDHYFAPSAYSSAASDNSSLGFVIPYGDNPNFPNEIGEVVYMNILVQAEKYVYIMTPYLVLDHEMTEILIYTAQRGVDVKIIFPHIPDKKSLTSSPKATTCNCCRQASSYMNTYRDSFTQRSFLATTKPLPSALIIWTTAAFICTMR